jgi:LmbE family N-acetylglucosaminyl deacetylase
MIELQLPARNKRNPLRILCLGAHCDDIDIGCGATLLKLLARAPGAEVTWVAFASGDERHAELGASAKRFLRSSGRVRLIAHKFRDTYFPAQYEQIKEAFEPLKKLPAPDLIFTHHRADLHQDHRLVSELTWNAFRNHLILEYEVPKYEGGLATPNAAGSPRRTHTSGSPRLRSRRRSASCSGATARSGRSPGSPRTPFAP